jgi:hypothetical protein
MAGGEAVVTSDGDVTPRISDAHHGRWPTIGCALSAVLVSTVLCAWYGSANEANPLWASRDTAFGRFLVLQQVVGASNGGYHYQFQPGDPMENRSEDSGLAYLTVTWGFAKRAVGAGPLDPWIDPQRVEFCTIILMLTLIYSPLFRLPRWFYWAIALAFTLAVLPWWQWRWSGGLSFPDQFLYRQFPTGLLYLGIDTYWAKFPATVWTLAVVLQLGLALRERRPRTERWFSAGRIGRPLVYGLVLGLFASIRKDVLVVGLLALVGALTAVPLRSWLQRDARTPGAWIAAVMLIALGSQIFPAIMSGTWAIRDRVYSIRPGPGLSRGASGHVTWHPLYAALGYVPNELGIEWDDGIAWEHVRRLPGNENLQFGSIEHDRAARELYIRTITRHPALLARNVRAKWDALRMDQHESIRDAAIAFIVFAVLVRDRWMAAGLLALWLGTLVLPLLVIPVRLFYIEFLTAGLLIVCAAIALAASRVASLASHPDRP